MRACTFMTSYIKQVPSGKGRHDTCNHIHNCCANCPYMFIVRVSTTGITHVLCSSMLFPYGTIYNGL